VGIALKNAPPGGTFASVRRWHCDGSELDDMMLQQENGHR
jgi:hypothetical protein